jgi:hypothetical protein
MLFFPTTDEDFQYFRSQGYTGSINDMHYAALGDLGYTGTITDRTYAYLIATYGSYHEAMRDLRDGTSVFSLFSLNSLFSSGEQGVLFDPSDTSTLFQDSAGTTPVTAAGQPVGRMLDLSGNGHHATQTTAGKRPTYQTDGTLHWLAFDGVDDAMATSSIDFSATDKMSAFAGVRKLSDATIGIMAELSPNLGSSPGSFAFPTPLGAGLQEYAFGSRGSVFTAWIRTGATAYPSPTSNVVTGIGDISGDSAVLRIDGAQVVQSTGDQGTGNYGNYPIYIGARAGTSLYFTGNLYGLTVRGALTDGTTLSKAESLVAAKTGVTL